MNKYNILSFNMHHRRVIASLLLSLALASTFGSAFLKHSRTQIPRRQQKHSITEILISGSPTFCNIPSELLRITSLG